LSGFWDIGIITHRDFVTVEIVNSELYAIRILDVGIFGKSPLKEQEQCLPFEIHEIQAIQVRF
jgi:hypothetical protein